MKLEVAQHQTTSNVTTTRSFGIREQDMHLILHVLRNQMYKEPIRAICQEVASNARDANREAGRGDEPIEIGKIVDLEETRIYFKDCGPGISPERMQDIFLNYGASTKRDDNVQTGGFGLGAKTPFAYAEDFTIETTTPDGRHYIYVATISDDNKGSIFLLEENDAAPGSRSGTTISIPVNTEDEDRFEAEIKRATYYWKPRPHFVGIEISNTGDEGTPLYISDDAWITAPEQDSLTALVDGIPYRVMLDEVTDPLFQKCNGHLVISVPVGALTLAATRESLQYDQKTKSYLKKRLKTIPGKINAAIERELAEAPTTKAALKRMTELKGILHKPDLECISELLQAIPNMSSEITAILAEDTRINKEGLLTELTNDILIVHSRPFTEETQKVQAVKKKNTERTVGLLCPDKFMEKTRRDYAKRLREGCRYVGNERTFKHLRKKYLNLVKVKRWARNTPGWTTLEYTEIKIPKEAQRRTSQKKREKNKEWLFFKGSLTSSRVRDMLYDKRTKEVKELKKDGNYAYLGKAHEMVLEKVSDFFGLRTAARRTDGVDAEILKFGDVRRKSILRVRSEDWTKIERYFVPYEVYTKRIRWRWEVTCALFAGKIKTLIDWDMAPKRITRLARGAAPRLHGYYRGHNYASITKGLEERVEEIQKKYPILKYIDYSLTLTEDANIRKEIQLYINAKKV